MPVTFVEISDAQAGQRLDNFLLTHLKGVPKSKVYNIIRRGEVRVNKGRVKPTYRLNGGDSIRVPPVATKEPTTGQVSNRLAQLLVSSVVFEDEQWLVVNKPNGLAVHGGSGLSLGLIEALRQMRPNDNYLELCHRIDKATSGCVVVAKTRKSLRAFHQSLREKRLQKTYHAMVVGRWRESNDAVNLPLMKNVLGSGERFVRVDQSGKPSLTHFKILERLDGFSLVEAKPVTGRTHQIRVHCQAMGHAIVGDDKYGNRDSNKQCAELGYRDLFLHAASIELPLMDESGQLASKQAQQYAQQMVSAPRPVFWTTFIENYA